MGDKNREKYKKPLFLHPLKFEEAIKFSLQVKPPSKEEKWEAKDKNKKK